MSIAAYYISLTAPFQRNSLITSWCLCIWMAPKCLIMSSDCRFSGIIIHNDIVDTNHNIIQYLLYLVFIGKNDVIIRSQLRVHTWFTSNLHSCSLIFPIIDYLIFIIRTSDIVCNCIASKVTKCSHFSCVVKIWKYFRPKGPRYISSSCLNQLAQIYA